MQTLKAFWILGKPRLSFFVVLSCVFSFFIGEKNPDLLTLLFLILGGFSVTMGASAFNQILEVKEDAKMKRTAYRPLVQQQISKKSAWFMACAYVVIGGFFLYQLHFLVFVFGLLSVFLYSFVYTPLKKYTAWSVLVGAIPGAFPSILGYVANTGRFDVIAGILFFVQFMWQFPHFWAIAWVAHEDYQRAGFSLLPLSKVKNKENAFVILIYTLMLIPASLLLWIFPQPEPLLNNFLAFLVLLAGLVFFYFAWKLYQDPSDGHAKKLMYASFLYLPVVQFIYLLH